MGRVVPISALGDQVKLVLRIHHPDPPRPYLDCWLYGGLVGWWAGWMAWWLDGWLGLLSGEIDIKTSWYNVVVLGNTKSYLFSKIESYFKILYHLFATHLTLLFNEKKEH